MFKRRGAAGRPPGTKNKPKELTRRQEKQQALWQARTSTALNFLKRAGRPVTSKELRAGVKLKLGRLQKTMAILQELKKVKREGWAEGTRWSLA